MTTPTLAREAAELTSQTDSTSAGQPAAVCPTCKGNGWMMDGDGEMCPDCQNPAVLGGTGYVGGAIPPELAERLERALGQ